MFAMLRNGCQRLNYERRVALVDGGWSFMGLLVVAALLYSVLDPWNRPDVMVFFGEPMPALLSGFLAARLVMPDYESGRLPFLLTRRSLFQVWVVRFALLVMILLLATLAHGALLHVLPPDPWETYYAYLPLTGFAAAFFFAISSSLVTLSLRQSLAGDLWTLLWGGLSLLMLFPSEEPYHTGIGPFFPFPIWFIHRRITAFPQLRPWLQASERVPAHFGTLILYGILLVLLHTWTLRRLRQEGV
ncbi:MAG: hypothetical protein Q9O62_08070 [Ardenticatenia bacterium]|nr:hypothetical protein [Ardenticatenia bacterium]